MMLTCRHCHNPFLIADREPANYDLVTNAYREHVAACSAYAVSFEAKINGLLGNMAKASQGYVA